MSQTEQVTINSRVFAVFCLQKAAFRALLLFDIIFLCFSEARRRKWLEDYPEATSNDEAVVFDTSIIPWWAWIKRFHLPEAERLNGLLSHLSFED